MRACSKFSRYYVTVLVIGYVPKHLAIYSYSDSLIYGTSNHKLYVLCPFAYNGRAVALERGGILCEVYTTHTYYIILNVCSLKPYSAHVL